MKNRTAADVKLSLIATRRRRRISHARFFVLAGSAVELFFGRWPALFFAAGVVDWF